MYWPNLIDDVESRLTRDKILRFMVQTASFRPRIIQKVLNNMG